MVAALHESHHPTVRSLVSLSPDVSFDPLTMRHLALSGRSAALSGVEREQLPVALAVRTASRDTSRAVGSVLEQLLHPLAVRYLTVGVVARCAVLQHLQVLRMVATVLSVGVTLPSGGLVIR